MSKPDPGSVRMAGFFELLPSQMDQLSMSILVALGSSVQDATDKLTSIKATLPAAEAVTASSRMIREHLLKLRTEAETAGHSGYADSLLALIKKL